MSVVQVSIPDNDKNWLARLNWGLWCTCMCWLVALCITTLRGGGGLEVVDAGQHPAACHFFVRNKCFLWASESRHGRVLCRILSIPVFSAL